MWPEPLIAGDKQATATTPIEGSDSPPGHFPPAPTQDEKWRRSSAIESNSRSVTGEVRPGSQGEERDLPQVGWLVAPGFPGTARDPSD